MNLKFVTILAVLASSPLLVTPAVQTYLWGVGSKKCLHTGNHAVGVQFSIYDCWIGSTSIVFEPAYANINNGDVNFVWRVPFTGNILGVQNGGMVDGSPVTQQTWTNGTEQWWAWKFLYEQNSYVYSSFVNTKSRKCLTVHGGATANFSPVDQWQCVNGTNQMWLMRTCFDCVYADAATCLGYYDTDGYYSVYIQNKASTTVSSASGCASLSSATSADQAPVSINICTLAVPQHSFKAVGPVKNVGGVDYFKIVNQFSSMCMTTLGGAVADNTQVVQAPCNDLNDMHLWSLVSHPTNTMYFSIRNLGAGNKCMKNLNSNVVISTCAGTDQEYWTAVSCH